MASPREQTYAYNTNSNEHVTAANRGTSSGRTNDTDSNPMQMVTSTAAGILGTTYCLVTLCILLILPIIEVAIGSSFRDQCTIEPRIPTYLVVTGACGIASIVLTLAISLAFCCFAKSGNLLGTVAVACVAFLVLFVLFLMSLFLFAWFIAGNVWIFGAKQNVVYDDVTSPNYCNRTLYDFAFAVLIISYIMCVISCLAQCARGCLQFKKET